MGCDDDESMTTVFDNDICLTNLTHMYKAINALKIDIGFCLPVALTHYKHAPRCIFCILP